MHARLPCDQKVEVEESLAPGEGSGGPLTTTQHTTYITYEAMELWEVAKQLKQKVGEMMPPCCYSCGIMALITELSPQERSQIAGRVSTHSLCWVLQDMKTTVMQVGNQTLINKPM